MMESLLGYSIVVGVIGSILICVVLYLNAKY